jgi:hypothetical protein
MVVRMRGGEGAGDEVGLGVGLGQACADNASHIVIELQIAHDLDRLVLRLGGHDPDNRVALANAAQQVNYARI